MAIVNEIICNFIEEHRPAFQVESSATMQAYYTARGEVQCNKENAVLHCIFDIYLERDRAFSSAHTNFFPLSLKDGLGSQLEALGKVCDMLSNIIQAHLLVADNLVIDSNLLTFPEPVNKIAFSISIWNTESEKH